MDEAGSYEEHILKACFKRSQALFPHLANTPRTRHKADVKDGHTTHGVNSFGKKLWCVLIVVFLGGIGWQMWKLNA